jgi:rRNA maturation endonuclease Nob1
MESGKLTMEQRKEIVICSMHEESTGRAGSIILDPDLRLLYCDLCNAYMCLHIVQAMSVEGIRKDRIDALRRICKGCTNYNLPGAKYCDECGSKLEVD